jgi:hypothetical protein
MDAITLSIDIGEDRRVVIDLPADTPVGKADLVIVPRGDNATEHNPYSNPATEAARAKLLAAGRLVTSIRAPEGTVVGATLVV